MKAIFCLFSALLLISSISASGKSSHNEEEALFQIEEDQLADSLLDYGVQWIFQNAADRYGVSNSDVEVITLNSYEEVESDDDDDDDDNNSEDDHSDSDSVSYKFDVYLTNNDDATINATFTVKYDTETEDKQVVRFRYHIEYTNHNTENNENTEDNTEYYQQDVVEDDHSDSHDDDSTAGKAALGGDIQDDLLADSLLDYGAEWIFQHAADKYGVSNTDIEVTEVNNYEQIISDDEDSDSVSYKFDVDLTNNNDATIEAKFTVEYDEKTEEKEVVKYYYHIDYKNNENGEDISGSTDNEDDVEGDLLDNHDDKSDIWN